MRMKHKTDLIKRSCYQAKNLIEEINKEVAALNILAKKGGRVFENEENYEIFVKDLENSLDELQNSLSGSFCCHDHQWWPWSGCRHHHRGGHDSSGERPGSSVFCPLFSAPLAPYDHLHQRV